ncbi:ankyrin repeat domain-containing protein [Paractinoplanes lichenicola]|uniref:Ankyrin repeat domain-containing protein n=1 Tax=Paractinoplanes lichenicola TaxID=2802976 RepID=A0ABS1VZ55_9ACTN|nr:ankyrin repeat domain-containing protein [Actinoplanes lichenicola]MBL7259708.1 ankyrin repeat domain-containing protein [Actinoplanes lichenicola]
MRVARQWQDRPHDRVGPGVVAVKRRRRKKLQRGLVEAAGWGEPRQVEALLLAGADPNAPDAEGTTPLYQASVQDRADNVRALVAAGADPNLESGSGSEGLPLCAAACWGHAEVVRILLAAGADPVRREDGGHGRNAVVWAGIGGHLNALELLRAAVARR